MPNNYLYHMQYASPYYDPVKAHEYYMEHRKLKGRNSTAGLNDKGKEAASYVKEQVASEKKRLIEEARSSAKSQRESNSKQASDKIASNREVLSKSIRGGRETIRSRISGETARMNEAISDIRDKLRRSPKGSNERFALLGKIDRMRQENARQREELNAAFNRRSETARNRVDLINKGIREDASNANSAVSEALKVTIQSINEKYDSVYSSELEKIFGNSEFVKGSSSKESSNKGSSKKKLSENKGSSKQEKKQTTSSSKGGIGFATDYSPKAWKKQK